jgi:hypothetical protein
MADIKQAAKWLQQGKKVRRSSWGFADFCLITVEIDDGTNHIEPFDEIWTMHWEPEDFLAEDWEIKE